MRATPEIGLGLDSRLGLSPAQLRDLAPEAKRLGYQSLWTNAGTDYDPVTMCVAWSQLSGLPTGVAVVPVQRNPASVVALAARTANELTGGAFTLGIGSGNVTDKPIRAVREYIDEVRRLAPSVRIAIGALGPQMRHLAATHADAAALNWCTPAAIAECRAQTGPDTHLIEYIRVCVDDDAAAARLALAKQILAYALMPRGSGSRGYPAHFERMGFGPELDELRTAREQGSTDEELARAMPERLVSGFGYYGAGDDAAPVIARLAFGLDTAIVRVLTPRPGDPKPVRRAMEALAPAH
ncbi:MAG TPA: LLM class flavin-dependent oxidoreductase [Candidatus Limnocylindrales bacterium]|nr:LLM class flavin-dependent oxidoreductase [Candidatus Limnocylindrales bacterium]